MALHLNLLHEREARRTERERDPLKVGFLVVLAVAGVLVLLHMRISGRLGSAKRELGALRAELARIEPQSIQAAQRERELEGRLRGSEALVRRAERRMLWGPLLATVAAAVPREIQLDSWNGRVGASGDTIEVALEGVAAGSEPRKVAEDFRLAVRARVATLHPKVDVRFRTLEDAAAPAVLDGQSWPTARFVIRLAIPHPRKEAQQ